MKTYKLAASSFFFYNIFIPSLVILFTIFGFVSLAIEDIHKQTLWTDLIQAGVVFLVWLCLVGLMLYTSHLPYEITIQDDNTIRFRSFTRKLMISPNDIKTIKLIKVIHGRFIRIELTKRPFYMINRFYILKYFDDLQDFLSTVKSLNPNIVIKNL
jgi:hypothetical protein